MAAEKDMKLAVAAPDYLDGRVDKLENTVGQMKTDLIENQLKLSFLATQVGEGFERASKQIEGSMSVVSKQIEDGLSNVSKHIELTLLPIVKEVSEHSVHISSIRSSLTVVEQLTSRTEAERQARKERWSSLKKFAVAIVTGGAAIGLKELVVLFFKHV